MPNEWRRRGLLHFPVIAWSCGVQTQGQLVGKCPTLASCSGFKFPKVAYCFRRLMVSMCPMEIFPSSEQSNRTAIAIRSTCNCRSVYLQLPFGLLAIAVRSTCNCRSVYWQLPFGRLAIAIRPTCNCRSMTSIGAWWDFLALDDGSQRVKLSYDGGRHSLYRAKPKIGGGFMRWLVLALRYGGCWEGQGQHE